MDFECACICSDGKYIWAFCEFRGQLQGRNFGRKMDGESEKKREKVWKRYNLSLATLFIISETSCCRVLLGGYFLELFWIRWFIAFGQTAMRNWIKIRCVEELRRVVPVLVFIYLFFLNILTLSNFSIVYLQSFYIMHSGSIMSNYMYLWLSKRVGAAALQKGRHCCSSKGTTLQLFKRDDAAALKTDRQWDRKYFEQNVTSIESRTAITSDAESPRY